MRPSRAEPDLAREVAAHLAMMEDDFARRGLPRDEARLAARRAFGGVEQTKERHRDARSFVWLDDARRDVQYAARSLRRTPGFTLVAIITLALGIGANTAMFSLADAFMLRPLAVHDPARLITLGASDAQSHALGILAPMVDLIRDEHLLAGVCGLITPSVIVEMHGRMSAVPTHTMTGDCFETLGVEPAIGRLLMREDDRPGAAHVVVLTYDTWVREYGADASAIGDTIDIDGARYRIVGVAQQGFRGVRAGFPARLFIPLGNFSAGLAAYFPPHDRLPIGVIARLPANLTAGGAVAALRTRWHDLLNASAPSQLSAAQRDRYLHRQLSVAELSAGVDDSLRLRFQKPLVALLAIAGVVLLLTCVNVANLLLARSSERRREATIRVALGASTLRLLQGAAIESAVLLAAGAAASLPLAYWVDALLIAIFKSTSPDFAIDIGPDHRVLAFTAGLSAVAFLLFALAPAWRASRVNAASMNAASPLVSGDRRLLRAATAAQVALSIVLLTVGGLFVGTLRQLRTAPLGLSMDRMIGLQLSPVPGGYRQGFSASGYYRALLDHAGELPDIEGAALSYNAPLNDVPSTTPVGPSGSDVEVIAEQAFVSDSFFSTMQIPLTAGGTFERDDQQAGIRTV
ncbi:MAG TPA: ABC transporter permease, partial [Vicinamibacterales bacterium]|nr:ABC transporter permease [Vicinamibacterales bacterium]